MLPAVGYCTALLEPSSPPLLITTVHCTPVSRYTSTLDCTVIPAVTTGRVSAVCLSGTNFKREVRVDKKRRTSAASMFCQCQMSCVLEKLIVWYNVLVAVLPCPGVPVRIMTLRLSVSVEFVGSHTRSFTTVSSN